MYPSQCGTAHEHHFSRKSTGLLSALGVDSPGADRPYAQHPQTEDVYTFFGGSFRKWTAATAQWSRFASRPSYANDDIVQASPSAVDPARMRVLYTFNQYRVAQQQGLVVSIDAGTVTEFVFPGSLAAVASSAGGGGLAFVPSEDAYLLKLRTGPRVIRIDGETFATTEVATAAGSPPDSANGVYTRWLYLPRLRGMVYLANGATNFWFLATE